MIKPLWIGYFFVIGLHLKYLKVFNVKITESLYSQEYYQFLIEVETTSMKIILIRS